MTTYRHPGILAAALVCLGACAGATGQTQYDGETGGYGVNVAEAVLPVAAQDKDLFVRVRYPDGDAAFPLVVFSHGAMCDKAMYAPVVENWVSHGYVVIEPVHRDSRVFGQVNFSLMNEIADSRIADMSEILDQLDAIESQVPGLAGRIDRDRVAAAGHSMGGATAMIASGFVARNAQGEIAHTGDQRYDAALLLSGPGPMPTTPDESWGEYTTPTLMTTGTKDITMTNKNKPEGWKWRLGSYELTPAGDKYALIIEDMDHFLGGAICGTNIEDKQPDTEALKLVNASAVAFLDAYLKNEDTARSTLVNGEIETLSARAEFRAK